MEMYPWQKEFIDYNGNITLKGGRQVGKSIAAAHRIIRLAKAFPGSTTLITSPSERQENYIYEKVKNIIGTKEKFLRRPTQTIMRLANGSIIFKFPVGKAGIYIEGLSSVDFLFIDEALRMPEESYDAIIPMLAEPKKRGLGWITLLSNTRGKPEGFFYDSFKRDDFKKFSINAEDCPHISKEFLIEEKLRLGDMRYTMIYVGDFVEFDYKFFSTELLTRIFTLKSWTMKENYSKSKKYYLGIDPARFGKNKAGFVVTELFNDNMIFIHSETVKKSSMVDLFNLVQKLHSLFNFQNIYVDGGGVGGGLVDFLTEKFGHKIIDLNNGSKGKTGKILKEDLYSNCLRLMEIGKLKGVYNKDLIQSLANINYDGEEFFGKETDLAEAAIRSCWAVKDSTYTPKII